MERKITYDSKDILEGLSVQSKPAHEWVNKKLDFLKNELGLEHVNSDQFEVIRLKYKANPKFGGVLGQVEFDHQVLGFIVNFKEEKLRVISVFAYLADRIVWIRREGRSESYNQCVFKKD